MFELVAKTEIDWKKLVDVLPKVRTDGGTSLVCFMDLLEEKPYIYSLEFVEYTFFFVGNKELVDVLRSRTNLKVLHEDGSGFVSGNLREWRDFVLACSKQQNLYAVRKLGNIVYSVFLREGLEIIFKDYYRNEQKDKTFYLEHK